MFTELEKKILDATDKQYEYIARDRDGCLYLSVNRLYYSGQYLDHIGTYLVETGEIVRFNAFNNMFKDVKSGGEPIYFRKPILTDAEREYLKAVFKPFAKRIIYVKKTDGLNGYYIWAQLINYDCLGLPCFDGKKMYTGMDFGKHYTLEEFGITYDN